MAEKPCQPVDEAHRLGRHATLCGKCLQFIQNRRRAFPIDAKAAPHLSLEKLVHARADQGCEPAGRVSPM